jgi:hypothetical protein
MKLKLLASISGVALVVLSFFAVSLSSAPPTTQAGSQNNDYMRGFTDAGGVIVVRPPPVPSLIVLDPVITAANAGNAKSLLQLSNLQANLPALAYQVTKEQDLTNPAIRILAPPTARLICPVALPQTNHPGNVWVTTAPGIVIDGFTVKEHVGIYYTAKAANCVWRNSTLAGGAYNAAISGGTTAADVTTGSVNCTIENVNVPALCDSCVFYWDRNGIQFINCKFIGSVGEIGLRIDGPAGYELPTAFIHGGEFSNFQNAYGKATIACRMGILTIDDGAIIHGTLGLGEVYPVGNPLLPPGALKPGFYAKVQINSCVFMDMNHPGTPPSNNDNASITANRGVTLAVTNCNFAGIGPVYPHRLPISTWDDSATAGQMGKGSSTTVLTNCTGNAPVLGATGGTLHTLLPVAHNGATETPPGSRWFP